MAYNTALGEGKDPIYREPTDDEVDLYKGDPNNWHWKTWIPTGSVKAVLIGDYDCALPHSCC